MPTLAGDILYAHLLRNAQPLSGSLDDVAVPDGSGVETISPIADPYGMGDTPFALRISGHVLASITTTERWDLVIESPINTEVARIRGIEEAATQMIHSFNVLVQRPDATSTSVRFIADCISGAGTWQASSLPVYNQYAIDFTRLPD